MQDCKPVATQISSNSKLIKAIDDDDCLYQTEYLSAIYSMMYLAVCKCPDVTFAVSSHAKFTSKPNKYHGTALKHLYRYLQGTQQLGISIT